MEIIKNEEIPKDTRLEELKFQEGELDYLLKLRSGFDGRHSGDGEIIQKKEEEIKQIRQELGLDIKEREEKNIELVSSSNTFEDLFVALEKIGSIKGTEETYSAINIINLIEMVRTGQLPNNNITRKFRIRDKVLELVSHEWEMAQRQNQKPAGMFDKITKWFN